MSTSAELHAALEGARSGDRILLEAATFRGSFVVPAGVHLQGAGVGATIFESEGLTALLTLETGAGTGVRGATFRSSASAAILVRGDMAATIEEVEIVAAQGIGIGAEGAGDLRLANVQLSGPITRETLASLPLEPTSTDTATHGVVLVRVARATLSQIEVHGFATFGALFVDSGVTWDGGDASDNARTGLMASGGQVDLTDVEVSRTLDAFSLIPSYNIVFANEVEVTSQGLVARAGEGYGILNASAAGAHVDLVVEDNSAAGLWVQDSAGVSVTGAGSRFANNSFAGIVAVESSDVTIADAAIENTRSSRRPVGETGIVEVGDGIQLVRSVDRIVLRELDLVGNMRAGILIDLGGMSTEDVILSSVRTDASGSALGVVAQNGTLTADWDASIERQGATLANDSSFLGAGGMLDIVGVVAPTDFPAPDRLATDGLSALGVVAPTD